ncbi:MAG: sensor histidine kinase [Alphaproteobacteria bacterium]|nr:sensor histidine kinase [Alphaproteobacteria bacterium]
MHFDDRLATVLRHRATGERAARTQYRQLLDLLGDPAGGRDDSLEAAAYLRLDALGALIPFRERARIIESDGIRIRNPRLVEWLAEAEPDVAAAALSRARLSEAEWAQTIPELPIRARGFLRHRRNLPQRAVAILDRLGVSDRGLPLPERAETPAPVPPLAQPAPAPAPANDTSPRTSSPEDDSGIAALVRRIEAFNKARSPGGAAVARESAPQLPLDREPRDGSRRRSERFAFATDVDGKIEWADPPIAPMVVGTDLVRGQERSALGPQGAFANAFFNRQPLREGPVELAGAERIAGSWLVDATPRFTRADGRFTGYVGRFRRPADTSAQDRAESEADRIRQLLHELRTPVNAIQGFAEVIQQQLFGATPHEYRALAAAIAGDSARMLAGFDELDRLVRLEGGVLDLEPGSSDFAAILRKQIEQLQTVLSSRVARLECDWSLSSAPIALEKQDAEMLAWRLLATIAATTGAGERIVLELGQDDGQLSLRCALPATLAAATDIFATQNRPSGGALSPGIFGAGFSLRLARAEARATGGELARDGEALVLTLPLLTGAAVPPSRVDAPDRATG